MKNRKLNYFFYFLIGLFLWHIYTFAQTPLAEENQKKQSPDQINEEDLIHFGDLIDVDVVGSVNYDWRGTLNPEGFLNGIDFVENPVNALCLTENDVALIVAESYKKILRDPIVIVKILDRTNRPLSILSGAVKTPHRFQIKRRVFLNELIISSGGLTDKVSGEIQIFRPRHLNCLAKINRENTGSNTDNLTSEKFVEISHNSESEYINIQISNLLNGKKEANPQIFSGDIITVFEAELIYITGGVVNPTNISSRSQVTLTRAIDSAGGLSKNADEHNVTIYRKEKGNNEIIEVDLTKIKLNQKEDILLKPLDVVEVSQKGLDKRKILPQFKNNDIDKKGTGNLPIKVID
jgi:protein involved in polysaccharide export with SLBB domain